MEFRHRSDQRYHVDDVIRTFSIGDKQIFRQDAPDMGDGRTVVGYPVVFNTWTEIQSWEGNFLERIAPEAANETLDKRFDKIQFMFNHGFNFALENTPIGKYRSINPDDYGAYSEARALDRGVNEMVDTVLELIRMGAIYGQSFRFQVLREEWVDEPDDSDGNPRGLPERTITEFRWLESGPVTFPAYEATTVSLRDGEPFAVRSREEFQLWSELRNIPPIDEQVFKSRKAAAALRSQNVDRVLRTSVGPVAARQGS